MDVTQTPSLNVTSHGVVVDNATRLPVWISPNDTYVVQDIFESMDAALWGVSVIAVVVVILLLVIVVLRYIAHQKGTYHTHEGALTFKRDTDVQIVQDFQDIQEDSEED